VDDLQPLVSVLLAGLLLVGAAILVIGFGIWFGMTKIAPRIVRALDRRTEDEETRDRPS
jgi:hypothetical protein